MSDLAFSTSERSCRYPGIRANGDANQCRQAARIFEAAELIRLGGRAGLVFHITGLEKKTVNRLYRQLQGEPSPPGQSPFTDAWYLENELRMLHASVVWHLYQGFVRTGRSAAQVLIDVYQAYKSVVRMPVLDLMRAAFVPRLIDMNCWEERKCKHCFIAYLAPLDSNGKTCPGCNLYFRHRCRACGGPINAQARGRRRRVCATCK